MNNNSGVIPVEYKCLIETAPVEEITSGGIILTANEQEIRKYEQVKATLIACGGNAFENWKGIKPQVGNKVLIQRHSGSSIDGVDNYRLISDRDITAISKDT